MPSRFAPARLHVAAFAAFVAAWTVALLVPIPEQTAREVLGPGDAMFWFAKAVHVGSYTFLAILGGTMALVGRHGKWVFAGLIGHGCLTEFIQTFVGRHGCVRDVLIDAIGVSIGAGLVLAWRRWSLQAITAGRANPVGADPSATSPPHLLPTD